MNDLKPFTFTFGELNHQKVIFISFENKTHLLDEVKKLAGSSWSITHKCWYVPDVIEYRKRFDLIEDFALGNRVLSKISTVNQHEVERLINQLKLKGYSPNTIRSYVNEFAQYLYYIGVLSATDCGENEVRNYLLYCINDLRLTESTIHSRINAIKFYYEQVLFQSRIFVEIPRPKNKANSQRH